jgi:hypothetical protein
METVRAEHSIQIVRLVPKGKANHHYVAFCSCRRWRSEPYRDREHAVTKGDVHSSKGDMHNRVIAAMNHGSRVQAKTEMEWYREQALDPLNSEKDREMWQKLADELADRMKGDDTEQQELPFE